ncbi:hypothetical protein GCM10012287_51240 [Streptomyces daqingensis]|uniref:Integral membrane protein n=1 Tax=Streptomyces daqingensis TaxID=1472640 RepID=A0ABQ2MVP8_9ACTN|nr:hypothetical protein GCM10012287_51240 [Streptomyces daqingensis]
MAALNGGLPGRGRSVLPVVLCVVWCCLVAWWPEEHAAPGTVFVLLGWGLGLLPVHVTLRGPWSGRGRCVRRPGRRAVRRSGRSRAVGRVETYRGGEQRARTTYGDRGRPADGRYREDRRIRPYGRR